MAIIKWTDKPSVGKNTEELKLPHIANGNVKQYIHTGKQSDTFVTNEA